MHGTVLKPHHPVAGRAAPKPHRGLAGAAA
jgi:hypothetical protein